jgi:hypothetical protein
MSRVIVTKYGLTKGSISGWTDNDDDDDDGGVESVLDWSIFTRRGQ